MSIRALSLILLIAIGSFGTEVQATTPICSLSASAAKQEIQQKGTREFMKRLSVGNYAGLTKLVTCITTGRKDWIDISKILVEATQPDTEDDLTLAVGSALDNNPENVLSETWPDTFTLNYICSPSLAEDFGDYASARAEMDKRIKMVRAVHRPDLKDKVDECLTYFEQATGALDAWYTTDKTN